MNGREKLTEEERADLDRLADWSHDLLVRQAALQIYPDETTIGAALADTAEERARVVAKLHILYAKMDA